MTDDLSARRFKRVAVISDVHGNLPALEACLADVGDAGVDAVVVIGDLTWGPQPAAVLDRIQRIDAPAFFTRGNAERLVLDTAQGRREAGSDVERWLQKAHTPEMLDALEGFTRSVTVRLDGLGAVFASHASPRSDNELWTPETPAEQIAEACAGEAAPTIAHGHTHLQYHRHVAGRTIVGVGSVGLPYGVTEPGARWTLLSESIEPQVSRYDIEDAIGAARDAGYPGLAGYERTLRAPLTLEWLIADAAEKVYSD